MNPLSLQPGGPRRAPRRKVRIVKPTRISHAVVLSFLLGLLVVVSFPLLWYIRRTPPEAVSTPQETRDWVWKCDAGHTFRAAFRRVTSHCLRCDKPAYPIGWYTCPVHGLFEVAALFEADDEGKMTAAKVRLTGRRWVTEEELECPRCDRRLVYKGRDPLERVLRARRQGGE